MAPNDHGDYFDRPIGGPLTNEYRGPDRRDGTDVATWPPTWLLAWPIAAVAILAAAWLVPTDPSLPAVALAALGIVAAGVSGAFARATGSARARDLEASSALLAVAGAAVLSDAAAASGVAAVVAAVPLGASTFGHEIDTRRQGARDWLLRVTAPATGIILLVLAERAADGDAFVAPTQAAAVLAWIAAFVLVMVRQRARGSHVTARSLHLAAAATLGAACHLLASLLDDQRLAVAGIVVVAAGLAAVTLSLVRLLGMEVETRRSQQHLQRVLTERETEVREAGLREAAHEARNAMTGIEAAAWGLRRLATDGDPRQQETIAALDNGIARLKGMLLPDERTDIDDTGVGSVLDPIVWLARGRGTQVTIVGDTDVRVACPSRVLGQALDNLFINAHLHGAAALRPVEVRVEVRDHHVDVVVHDQGPGLPQALDEDVFQPGVRRGANAGEGLGLGLARELLRAHGGDLTADRTADGASFRVRLRRPRADAVPDRDRAEERDHRIE